MKPTQTLPENFVLAWSFDLKHNTRINIILQAVGLVWMALAGWLLTLCVAWIRPELKSALTTGIQFDMLSMLGLLIVVMVVAILIHELVHGFLFWLFSRHRPKFGIGMGYAFAAMPDWFFPKQQYLVIGLSPLVVLTVLGLAASVFVPFAWLGVLLAGMTINAGGAIGDMYICWRIAIEAPEVWINDKGDGFQLYRRKVD
jgi:hypothetical protein